MKLGKVLEPIGRPWQRAKRAESARELEACTCEPRIAERRALGRHKVVAEFDPRAAAGDQCGAVLQSMSRSQVAAQHCRGVVEKPAPVGFPGGFEMVQQPSKQFRVGGVPLLRRLHFRARRIVTHLVRDNGNIQALEQGRRGHAIGENAGAVRLERREHDVVHEPDLVLAGDARLGFGESGFGHGHVDPLLLLAEAPFNLAHPLEILVELRLVGLAKSALQVR
jgi:hypothetical protein